MIEKFIVNPPQFFQKKIPDYEENTNVCLYLLRNQELAVPGRDLQTILLELYEFE
ncbi:hypothetical protein NCCP133_26210 [Cytobacillus sp. NCCP-133]|nr:hypothetical protein NCCP133_26210 [Cytobacillus sp. NCCP-133]